MTSHAAITYDTLNQIRRPTTKVFFYEVEATETRSQEYRLYLCIDPNTFFVILDNPTEIAAFEGTLLATSVRCTGEGDAFALAANEMWVAKDTEGRVKGVVEPRVGSETIYATHNFCDRTTWFNDSVRVVDEVLTETLPGLTFTSAHPNWIDIVSGRILDDDGLSEEQQELHPDDPHGYKVIVKANGQTLTARAPFETSGGDYTIDFDAGKVTFLTNRAGQTITASYSYGVGSTFKIAPLPGTILNIEAAEADFSSPIAMTDTIVYAVYGYADVFAPELVANNIVPPGTQIELKKSRYKRYPQILTEAIGAYPTLAANASLAEHLALDYPEFRSVSRGSKDPRQAVPFRYATVRDLHASAGMELRIWLEHDRVFGGEHATLTFYCTSRKV